LAEEQKTLGNIQENVDYHTHASPIYTVKKWNKVSLSAGGRG
jgi:hypothetical protein